MIKRALPHSLLAKLAILAFTCLIIKQISQEIVFLHTLSKLQLLVNQPVVVHKNTNVLTLKHSIALFGDNAINLQDANIQPSMLQLTIEGILFSHDARDSSVIIQSSGNDVREYHEGDIVPGGGRINRITEDAVIILHNNTLERLSLPENKLIFSDPSIWKY